MLVPHGVAPHDPIRAIEDALAEARRRVAKMRPDSPLTIQFAFDAVVHVGDAVVAAFRQIGAKRNP